MLAKLLMIILALLVILILAWVLNRFVATLFFTLPALGLGFVAGFVTAAILFMRND
jgi:hypothetical protein